MDAEQAKKLREPFPPSAIGKLPKPTKKDNPKGRCDVCGGWHGLPAVHLDYVGHAATTDRLLSVDPDWTWEPMAHGPNGEPLITNGGLWINLTVCGVTRPGFGDGNSPKEIIGDAIRNAAMRFGVALDLWAKEDIHSTDESGAEPAPTGSPTGGEQASPGRESAPDNLTTVMARLAKLDPQTDWPVALDKTAREQYREPGGLAKLTQEQRNHLAGRMIEHADKLAAALAESAGEPRGTGTPSGDSSDAVNGTTPDAASSPADTPFKAPTGPRGSKGKAAA